MNLRTPTLLLLMALSLPALPQKADSLRTKKDSMVVRMYTISALDTTLMPGKYGPNADTAIAGFHIFDPLTKKYPFNYNLGNIGLASGSMVFKPRPGMAFDYGLHTFDAYLGNFNDATMYASLSPFTELNYTWGLKREQTFRVTHHHSVRGILHMGVSYHLINSQGRGDFHQKSNDHAVNVYTYVHTRNQRYGAVVNYLYNRVRAQENGGINNDSLYIDFRKGNTASGYDINLREAENHNRESGVQLKQYVTLYNFHDRADSSGERSYKKLNLGRIVHTFRFTKRVIKYFDNAPNAGFYPDIPGDTGAVNDSLWFYSISNSLLWTNSEMKANGENRMFRYYAGAGHEYVEMHQQNGTYYLANAGVTAGITATPLHLLRIGVSGSYGVWGDRKGDVMVQGNAKYVLTFKEKNYGMLGLSAAYSNTTPAWFYEHYHSKYYTWDQDYLKQGMVSASLTYNYAYLDLDVSWYQLHDYIYMNTLARPSQHVDGSINVFAAGIRKKFNIGKFGIDTRIQYQACDEQSLLRLPALAAWQEYTFTSPLFKKALLFQIGFDLLYNTRYYANAYQPASRMFYLQNDRELGNYLYLDVFLNLKIKRFRIFAGLYNALSGVIGYDTFTVLHYPMQDRTFRFGLNWLFYD